MNKAKVQKIKRWFFINVEDITAPKYMAEGKVASKFLVREFMSHYPQASKQEVDQAASEVAGLYNGETSPLAGKQSNSQHVLLLDDEEEETTETEEKYVKKPIVVKVVQAKTVETIETLEGDMIAEPGDYIITGIKGERYPCKPDIFAKTYEKAPANAEIGQELEIEAPSSPESKETPKEDKKETPNNSKKDGDNKQFNFQKKEKDDKKDTEEVDEAIKVTPDAFEQDSDQIIKASKDTDVYVGEGLDKRFNLLTEELNTIIEKLREQEPTADMDKTINNRAKQICKGLSNYYNLISQVKKDADKTTGNVLTKTQEHLSLAIDLLKFI
jgi:hypothetical protein